MRVHRRAVLDALGDGTGWSVDVPRLRLSDDGLVVELPARQAYTREDREVRVLIRGPGELVVEEEDQGIADLRVSRAGQGWPAMFSG